jgi:hypothetical protein
MRRIVWILLPITAFFFLLLVSSDLGCRSDVGATMYLLQGLIICAVVGSTFTGSGRLTHT